MGLFWKSEFGLFILGKRETQAEDHGKITLTCLTDSTQHLFDSEQEAKAFAETYRPKVHEMN